MDLGSAKSQFVKIERKLLKRTLYCKKRCMKLGDKSR